MLIHEECGNFKVFVGDGEHTRHITEKKKPGVLQTYGCPLSDKCFMREYFCNKHVEYCESVKYCESLVNDLREQKFFLAQMNRNRFDLILAWSYWNCSTMENLRCLNSAFSTANELILLKQFGEAIKLLETALETRKR